MEGILLVVSSDFLGLVCFDGMGVADLRARFFFLSFLTVLVLVVVVGDGLATVPLSFFLVRPPPRWIVSMDGDAGSVMAAVFSAFLADDEGSQLENGNFLIDLLGAWGDAMANIELTSNV